jgi:hypothetical protein
LLPLPRDERSLGRVMDEFSYFVSPIYLSTVFKSYFCGQIPAVDNHMVAPDFFFKGSGQLFYLSCLIKPPC